MKKLIFVCLLVPELIMAEAAPVLPAPVSGAASVPALQFSKSDTLATDSLQRYAGVYQLNEQFAITVSVEDGKLYGLAPGDAEKTAFSPVAKNKFIIEGPQTEVEFLEENGQVHYMFVNMQEGTKLKKVR
ncbi:uncharacterized protein DUF3471 [Pontibacter ummariensis]|uniref:Peptidase S12 Pab87-related C-terminal domain-containing protein n=1 Tax=Pontibacter ummariensis TaxID=1610492 RepID=A0A239GH83_9BACT|nr:DUF3471 domain-containing protein [Pontibacter ummariensis]PRY11256.1 uncharacterized protein DUF3471 [Pontibacter ummariensis]SNS68245.1 protein of unknown function [Pontibacter ummariensis]